MKVDRALIIVVLPVPVPPDTSTFALAWMQSERKSRISSFKAPARSRPSMFIRGRNFRIEIDSSLLTTLSIAKATRAPGSSAVTKGLAGVRARSDTFSAISLAIFLACSLSRKRKLVVCSAPSFSIVILFQASTRISVISSSRHKGPRTEMPISSS